MNTIAGCRPGTVDSMTFALRTTPSRAVMSTDRNPVVDAVVAAAASDPGEHGDGVEVVVETPKLGFFQGLFRDRVPDQARLVVTRAGGAVGYPFSIQIVSEHGGRAARLVSARPGWATSDSAGLA